MRKTGALHEDLERSEEIAGGSDRAFGLVFAGFFGVLSLWPLTRGGSIRLWPIALAAGFLGVALWWPRLLAPLNRWWTRFGLLLQRIVSPVILGLLFYLTVTPVALVGRLLGKKPLSLGFDRAARSYWIARRPPGPAPDTMPNQF